MLATSQSSYRYTSAGASLHANTSGVDLEQAEELECKDAKQAFALYQSIAGENLEAGYRCGLMLLEGRGAERDFWQAYSYVKAAAVQGHVEAGNVLSKIEERMNCLCEILAPLSEAGMHNDGALKIPPALQNDLQHKIVKMILSDKKERDEENIVITYRDITEAIDDISKCLFQHNDSAKRIFRDCLNDVISAFPFTKSNLLIMTQQQQLVMVENIMLAKENTGKEGTEKWTITCHDIITLVFSNKKRSSLTPVWFNTQQIEKKEVYPQHLMASLLSEGIELYNQREQACVGIAIQEYSLPKDMWRGLDKLLSTRTQLQLLATSKFHLSLFPQNDKWWLSKLESGVAIPPQDTHQKISPQNISSTSSDFFSNAGQWFFELITSKEPPLAETLPGQTSLAEKIFFLENPGQRKTCNLLLDKAGKEYLKKQGININNDVLLQKIENGQSLEEIKKIQSQQSQINEKVKASPSSKVKEMAANAWILNSLYSGALTVEQLSLAERPIREALVDPVVQAWLEEPENSSYLSCILESIKFATAVRNQWMRGHIKSGWFTAEYLTKLSWNGMEAFGDQEVQKWLDETENSSRFLDFFISHNSARAMREQWVRDKVKSGWFTLEDLTKLSLNGVEAFGDRKVQKWLDETENSSRFLDFFIPDNSARAMREQWVRDKVKSGWFTLEDLTKLSLNGVKAFGDRKVQKWLDETENSSRFLDFFISDNSARAMREQWVRDKVKSGWFTLEDLTKLSLNGVKAFGDRKVQKWLDETENSSRFLDFFISDNSARAMREQWVRDEVKSGRLTRRHLSEWDPITID